MENRLNLIKAGSYCTVACCCLPPTNHCVHSHSCSLCSYPLTALGIATNKFDVLTKKSVSEHRQIALLDDNELTP